mmetsp:Transcript_7163/g.12465  ORF Transcript_7163/g.12465 Transcript_7163/m.12465 type:complete len:378 (-) Transcript_7163:111-1244(-)
MLLSGLKVVLLLLTAVSTVGTLLWVRSTGVGIVSVAEWTMGCFCFPFSHNYATRLQNRAWQQWRDLPLPEGKSTILEVPSIDISEYRGDQLKDVVESRFGKDWRNRPLLFKGLWNLSDSSRFNQHLSIDSLQKRLDLEVPYYMDGRRSGPQSLHPDSFGPISDVLANMTVAGGMPHKVATTAILKENPALISEIAPEHVVRPLFGHRFTANKIRLGLLVATLVLVKPHYTDNTEAPTCGMSSDVTNLIPRTNLHCEPAANLAIQFQGERQWTLIDPKYSFHLLPAFAQDGRAYLHANVANIAHIPRYVVNIKAGDGLYIPEWIWHKVHHLSNNKEGDELSYGVALFHTRPSYIFRNNPIFGTIVLPSLVKEYLDLIL